MVPPDLMQKGDFDTIEKLVRDAVVQMLGFELSHVGINAKGTAQAQDVAKSFAKAFFMDVQQKHHSVFAGTMIEVLEKPTRGQCGHIAVGTTSVMRAKNFLERNGFAFDEESVQVDQNGKMKLAYLRDEIGGFAIHLIQKEAE